MPFTRGFDFNPGNLGRNLAKFNDDVQDLIRQDAEAHAFEAELTMKSKAPWTDRTTRARQTLWADADTRPGGDVRIEMGHGMDYGKYLENHNERRFAIVRPTIRATGLSFMRSMERMFARLETNAPAPASIVPNVETKPTTTRERPRDERGRFARIYSSDEARRLARNARRRMAYAAKKAAGTLPTRRTRRK